MKSIAAAIVLAALSDGTVAFIVPCGPVASSSRLAMSDYGTFVRDRADVDVGGSSPLAPFDSSAPISRTRDGAAPSPAEIWEDSSPVLVQGGSLRTWSFSEPMSNAVQVILKSEGRPIDVDVELWNGPDNAPQKIRAYVEDGALRSFCTVMGTPPGPNTVSVRNIGQLEFPFDAVVRPDASDGLAVGIASAARRSSQIIQGGSMRTFPFDPSVDSVAVVLRSDGRPVSARVELLQGPNNNKQVMELYTEDGLDRPFFAVVETPGAGNVVRVANSAPLEFPLYASVEAYTISNYGSWSEDASMIGQWPRL